MVVRVASLPFDVQCRLAGLPVPVPEFRFASPRRWRFDWAFMLPGLLLAMEVQGAIFVHGRHTRGAALLKEHEKLNSAAMHGWLLLYVTPKQIANGEALEIVRRTLEARKAA